MNIKVSVEKPKPPPVTVTVTLDQKEALFLMILCGNIGGVGSPTGGSQPFYLDKNDFMDYCQAYNLDPIELRAKVTGPLYDLLLSNNIRPLSSEE